MEEKKIEMFETMLKYETLAEKKTYDGVNYFDMANGAFSMLEIIGLSREYIRWAEGKEYNVYTKKVMAR